MKYLFDSNILIYHLKDVLSDVGEQLLLEALNREGAFSTITKIELLGYPQDPALEQRGRTLLGALQEIPLTVDITEQAIRVRKIKKIKLPDAIIASTALVFDLQLISRNIKDFGDISSLNLFNPF